MKCLECSHLGGYNTTQTGRFCNASANNNSPVSEFTVYNPERFYCSEFEKRREPVKITQWSTTDKRGPNERTKAATAN